MGGLFCGTNTSLISPLRFSEFPQGFQILLQNLHGLESQARSVACTKSEATSIIVLAGKCVCTALQMVTKRVLFFDIAYVTFPYL